MKKSAKIQTPFEDKKSGFIIESKDIFRTFNDCIEIKPKQLFPDLNAIHEIEAHDKEIDDIEFSPDNTKVVSISKDGRALVWDVKKGKKHAEMGWDKGKVKYLYKRIRFGRIEGDSR